LNSEVPGSKPNTLPQQHYFVFAPVILSIDIFSPIAIIFI